MQGQISSYRRLPVDRSSHPSMSDAPVRSGHAQSFTQPHPQAQQRKSMPPPSPRSQYPGQPWSTHSSVSSRLSPALSQHSAKVRVNMQIPSRQTSADSAWDERLKTPKETWPETPREQNIAQVAVQDAVEAQFDHLLVSGVSYPRFTMLTPPRNRFKSLHRSERSSQPSHPTSNPPYCLPP